MISASAAALLAAVALTAGAVSPASAMTVQPVVLDLQTSGRGMSQTLTVENTFPAAVPVELRVQEVSFDENGEQKLSAKDPGDLVVFPPQAMIQPGQTQSFRIQYVGDPALAKSKHYYVTVAQLPVKQAEDRSAIQILYNFQVLVSVAPQGAKPALHVTSAQVGRGEAGKPAPVITIANDSASYGYLSQGQLRLVERDPSGREIFHRTLSGPEIRQRMGLGLVAAGQTRRLTLPIDLPAEGGSLEARFTPEASR